MQPPDAAPERRWRQPEKHLGIHRSISTTDNGRRRLLTATELLSSYCRTLYARLGSYEQVARHIELDRRTVKKYIERGVD